MPTQLRIPTTDTYLHAVDAPGGAPALLFLNGGFGTLGNWNRVIQQLAEKYRTVRFDARARGKSGISADYSIAAAVEDIGKVIQVAGLDRPVRVGWSHGATLAVRFAARHPEQIAGLVLIDGAYPITMFDEAGQKRVYAQFRRLKWIMRILAVFGLSARMSPTEAAEVVIDLDAANGALSHDFAALACPTVYVMASGSNPGSTEEEMCAMRAAVVEATTSNDQVTVFATVSCGHGQVLNKAADTVAAAIESVVRRTF